VRGVNSSIFESARTPIKIQTLACTQLRVHFANGNVRPCSGFLGSYCGQLFLITNWHCLSGRDSFNKENYIQRDTSIPCKVEFDYYERCGENYSKKSKEINLYESSKPIWLVHNKFKEKIDVCAINLTKICALDFKNVINIECGRIYSKYDLDQDLEELQYLYPSVSEEVFVLCSIRLKNGLESNLIWKKASVASEPWFYADEKHPFFYIDCASRSGMSGSPVLYFGKRFVGSAGELVDLSFERNSAYVFLAGVYSGRDQIPEDEHTFTLGRVWRNDAVIELLENGIPDPNVP
jgi:hypothetical protein